MPKNIVIIGSTGSIGRQTLEVIRANPSAFQVIGLSAHNNSDLLKTQIEEFNPKYGGTLDKAKIKEMVTRPDTDIVVFACRTSDMIDVLYAAIDAGKKIAMVNKEMIVDYGEELMPRIKNSDCTFIPVDSEHSALFQILQNRNHNEIEKVILTCSGGPFYNIPKEKFKDITVEEALKHPRWSMGSRITIDSATMMNKAIEIIEAKYLFNLDPSQIEVLVHPECVVHAIVNFRDGSSVAHMGYPDMRLPISYALYYPEKTVNTLPRVDLTAQPLTFIKPDTGKFPSIDFAYEALEKNTAKKLLKANQQAVEKFLNGEIGFHEIFKLVRAGF